MTGSNQCLKDILTSLKKDLACISDKAKLLEEGLAILCDQSNSKDVLGTTIPIVLENFKKELEK